MRCVLAQDAIDHQQDIFLFLDFAWFSFVFEFLLDLEGLFDGQFGLLFSLYFLGDLHELSLVLAFDGVHFVKMLQQLRGHGVKRVESFADAFESFCPLEYSLH